MMTVMGASRQSVRDRPPCPGRCSAVNANAGWRG
jgi:hypothetical protein